MSQPEEGRVLSPIEQMQHLLAQSATAAARDADADLAGALIPIFARSQREAEAQLRASVRRATSEIRGDRDYCQAGDHTVALYEMGWNTVGQWICRNCEIKRKDATAPKCAHGRPTTHFCAKCHQANVKAGRYGR